MPAALSLTVISLIVVWMGLASGGYFVADWTLTTLILSGMILAGIVAGALRGPGSRAGVIALSLFGAYAVWTFVSMLWAPNKGDAWLGAGLTLLYVLALWLTTALVNAGGSRRWVLATSALGPSSVAALTVWTLGDRFETLFENGRLLGTVGYHNGEAAFLLVPFWVSMYLAGSPRVSPLLRGVTLAGAVLSLEVAVLTQSRGAMVAMAASALVFFLLSGQRLRGLLALAPVALALIFTFPGLNEVYRAFTNGGDPSAAIGQIAPVIWFSAVVAGIYGLLWGILDRRWRPPAGVVRASGGLVLAGILIVTAWGTFAVTERAGNPVLMVQQKWDDFKTNDMNGELQSRYTSLSGRGRYSLWQIAWQDFVSNPAIGVGAQNYEATYYQLRDQRNTGSVRQPHMLALEVLAERGLVGGVLFFGFLATCAAAGLRVRFGGFDPDRKAQVAALLSAATYWFVHSSVEWFWQIPAVTMPAMIYLGMLITPWYRRELPTPGWPLRAAGIGAVLLTIAVVVPLYLSDRYLAQSYAAPSPAQALVSAERAQRLDPLNPLIRQQEANLALRVGDRSRAREALEAVVRLNPRHYASYALLASFYERQGEPVKALELYREALTLNPLSPDLERRTARAMSRAVGKRITVRLADGEAQTSLDLEVRRGFSGEGSSALSAPSGADGVLLVWPGETPDSFSGRSSGDLAVAFATAGGKLVSVKPLPPSGEQALESLPGYAQAVVADRGFFRKNGIGEGGQLVFAGVPEG